MHHINYQKIFPNYPSCVHLTFMYWSRPEISGKNSIDPISISKHGALQIDFLCWSSSMGKDNIISGYSEKCNHILKNLNDDCKYKDVKSILFYILGIVLKLYKNARDLSLLSVYARFIFALVVEKGFEISGELLGIFDFDFFNRWLLFVFWGWIVFC